MTAVYEWYAFPHMVDIQCPHCGSLATFEFAEVVQIKQKKDINYFVDSDIFDYQQFVDSCGHKWHAAVWYKGITGNDVDRVDDLPQGYAEDNWHHSRYFRTLSNWRMGSTNCTHCFKRSKHCLEWPTDAWWKIDYRNDQLWSFNRESTVSILGFIEATERNEKDFKWAYMLRHLPKAFLKSNARDTITKRLRKLLQQAPNKAAHPSR